MVEPAPDEVRDLAEACIRFVREALGLELDYTHETLPVLDHYLKERAADAQAEVQELIAPAAGAYFGEVVRRVMSGARWYAPVGDYRVQRIEFDAFFLTFNPTGVAMEVVSGQDADGWGAHFHVLDEARPAVSASLESTADVDTTDYYTLSLRLEVLQQIADVLLSLEHQQPNPRHFGPDVYRAAEGRDTVPGALSS
jgi:catechol 2,3-dioxygenase-like lactoylglutathione lyase family enzyme